VGGGAVWYLDCELAEGYADLTPDPVREAKALFHYGAMRTGARPWTTHPLI
jgi:hypothetical protein